MSECVCELSVCEFVCKCEFVCECVSVCLCAHCLATK